ncbi:MAG: hypothetical protein ACTH31_02715 [Pseudoclavibacter sp.]
MQVEQRSRTLVVTIGDPAEDDALEFKFKPVTAAVGAQLSAQYFDAVTSVPDEAGPKLDDWAKTVLADHYDTVSALRSEEANEVIMAAFLWQVEGGGIRIAKQVSEEGVGKALDSWLTPIGRSAQLMSSNGAAATATLSPASTTGTSIPPTFASKSKG